MKKKLLSTLLLAGTLLIGSTVSAYAQDVSSDPLQPYEDRLEELSTELGTDLAIVRGVYKDPGRNKPDSPL